MDKFKYVLYLFACAAKGERAEIVENIDITDIYTIARKHGIWSIVFLAIKEIYKENENAFDMDEALYNALNANFLKFVYKSIAKWNTVPQIIEKLTEMDIDVCLLKGLTLGKLYSEPYTRATADIDLLIDLKDEEKACKILEKENFDIKYRTKGSHHTKCIRKDIGLIELHTQLYDKKVQEFWFKTDVKQNYELIDFEYDNLKCKQLNNTDGLIFNFLHFVKHYIAGMITVKQLMDIMLYIKEYRETIDFEKVESHITKLNYFNLYKIFKCIAVQYLGFSLEELKEDNTLYSYSQNAELVLEDIYKYAANENASVYHIYTKNMENKSNATKKKAKATRAILALLWADKKRMRELYGAAYNNVVFKPFLQLHRILIRVRKIKKHIHYEDKMEKKESLAAQERIVLFQKIGVL